MEGGFFLGDSQHYVVPYEAEVISYSNGALNGRSDCYHLLGILQAIHIFEKLTLIDGTTPQFEYNLCTSVLLRVGKNQAAKRNLPAGPRDARMGSACL